MNDTKTSVLLLEDYVPGRYPQAPASRNVFDVLLFSTFPFSHKFNQPFDSYIKENFILAKYSCGAHPLDCILLSIRYLSWLFCMMLIFRASINIIKYMM